MKVVIAGLVTGLVSVLVAGCSSSGGGTGSATPAAPSTTVVTSTAAGHPSTSSTSSTRTAPGTAASSDAAHVTPAAAAPKLAHFRVADLTWVGSQGWALGGADCLGGKGTCDAIEHTSDGGKHWSSMPAPRANIAVPGVTSGCAAPCVSGLRFATSKIGYAFNGLAASSPALFMTLDGGRTWGRLAGGAVALEAANGDVVRVTSTGSGCPGPCHVGVETGPAGGTAWTRRSLGGTSPPTFGLLFGRTGARVYLLFEGHAAGGGAHAYSTLYRSADSGANWHNAGEPCPQSGSREYDSDALSSAPNGDLALNCQQRGVYSQFVITSTNGGTSFHSGSRTALGAAPVQTLGAANAPVLVVTADDAYRSTDGGNHFARLDADAGSSPGLLAWLGFASASVGHGISADRHSIETTTDGGRTWARYRFS